MAKKDPQSITPSRKDVLKDMAAMSAEDLEELRTAYPSLAAYIENLAHEAQEAENKRQTEHTLARTDELTGAPNRRALREQMGDAIKSITAGEAQRDPEKAQHISLIFIDANDFGLVNKAIGDPAGDIALQAVARFFQKNLRKGDFFARKGGDEFVIMMRCPPEEAHKRMMALKKDFRQNVTGEFHKGLAELFPGTVQEELDKLKDAVAKKHKNPALSEKPFKFSISFGIREINPKEVAHIDTEDAKSVGKFISKIFIESDKLMRADKKAYRKSMQDYPNIPDPDGHAAKHQGGSKPKSRNSRTV
jgi:diguanylate cyclase (GGDEF)-like protein